MPKAIIGLDIGGTKILSGIIAPDGRILARKKEPTRPMRDAAEILDGIGATVTELMRMTGVQPEDILGAAAGAPGPLDYCHGIIKDPPNLNWREFPLRDELSKRLGRPLLLENDANLAALGEWRFGKSGTADNLIYVTVSTGIGSGIVIKEELYRGRDGAAGELGRMMFSAGPGVESIEVNNCLEDLASGTAIAKQAEDLRRQGGWPNCRDYCSPDLPVTAVEVGQAARRGSPEARAIVARAGQYLGMAIVNLVNIFNPDRIVIGGGAGLGLQDLWSRQLQGYLEKWASPALCHDSILAFTALGEDIGLLGCAAAVLQDLEKKGKRPGNSLHT